MKHSAVAAVNCIILLQYNNTVCHFPDKMQNHHGSYSMMCSRCIHFLTFAVHHFVEKLSFHSELRLCAERPLTAWFSSLKSISFLKIMESMQCGDIWISGVPFRWRGIDYYSVFTCMVPARGEMAAVCFFFTSAHHDELWQLTSEQPVKESACNEQPACLRDTCHHISNKVILLLSLPLSITHSHAAFSHQIPEANARDAYLRLIYLLVCKQVHLDCT